METPGSAANVANGSIRMDSSARTKDAGRFAQIARNRKRRNPKRVRTVAFDKRFYQDPARHAKFERERVPCFGCLFASKLLGKRFCTKGKKMKKCGSWKETE